MYRYTINQLLDAAKGDSVLSLAIRLWKEGEFLNLEQALMFACIEMSTLNKKLLADKQINIKEYEINLGEG